jgi:hypothetical protein
MMHRSGVKVERAYLERICVFGYLALILIVMQCVCKDKSQIVVYDYGIFVFSFLDVGLDSIDTSRLWNNLEKACVCVGS